MSRVPNNQLFRMQHNKLNPAIFKRAVVVSVNAGARTANIYFVENPQTIIKNVPLAGGINANSIQIGSQAKVDTFSETRTSSMVIAYVF
jgi:hypothetical protein